MAHNESHIINKDGKCKVCEHVEKPNKELGKKDTRIIPEDDSTTILKKKTTCCGGFHQTIAGAVLNSPQWEIWYKHATKHMLFDVDETQTIDAMSSRHFKAFMDFTSNSRIQEFVDELLTKWQTKDFKEVNIPYETVVALSQKYLSKEDNK